MNFFTTNPNLKKKFFFLCGEGGVGGYKVSEFVFT